MIAPTGQQYVLTRGTARAVVVELAAGLREFKIDGVDLTQPYDEFSLPPFACGIVLVPWPNRVADGAWTLNGAPQQLDITEPARNNAIHGLLRNAAYRVAEQAEAAITLAATVFPQRGYPFHLETTVRYELVADGLDVVHTIVNRSTETAPVALGTHPFLTIGGVDPAELVLTVHAGSHVDVDARLNPVGVTPVDGTALDLRAGRRLGDLQLDDGFGAVHTIDGAAASLRAPDGREVRLLQDENFPWIQVFTTRQFPGPDGPTLAVAIEPMTAPTNAFNSDTDVRWLEPDEAWSVGWGIQYVR